MNRLAAFILTQSESFCSLTANITQLYPLLQEYALMYEGACNVLLYIFEQLSIGE